MSFFRVESHNFSGSLENFFFLHLKMNDFMKFLYSISITYNHRVGDSNLQLISCHFKIKIKIQKFQVNMRHLLKKIEWKFLFFWYYYFPRIVQHCLNFDRKFIEKLSKFKKCKIWGENSNLKFSIDGACFLWILRLSF